MRIVHKRRSVFTWTLLYFIQPTTLIVVYFISSLLLLLIYFCFLLFIRLWTLSTHTHNTQSKLIGSVACGCLTHIIFNGYKIYIYVIFLFRFLFPSLSLLCTLFQSHFIKLLQQIFVVMTYHLVIIASLEI